MTQKQAIQLFEERKVRTVWDADAEKWYFSIVDVVAVLTDSTDPKQYIKKLRSRDTELNSKWGTICTPLRMLAPDGKNRVSQAADTEGLFRLIQSIPSHKAEPFKQWMAQVAAQRIDQMQDPELSIDQAVADYRRLGYSESWINQRMKSIEVRKHLTDEWHRAGVQEGQQYASLTDIIYRQWSGLSAKEYKKLKGLKKENLRDNMTDLEIAVNMLAEATTTDLHQQENPQGFGQSAALARRGGKAAGQARRAIEKEIGHPIVSSDNARSLTAGNDAELLPLQEAEGDKPTKTKKQR